VTKKDRLWLGYSSAQLSLTTVPLSAFGVSWKVSNKPPVRGRGSGPNMAVLTVHPNKLKECPQSKDQHTPDPRRARSGVKASQCPSLPYAGIIFLLVGRRQFLTLLSYLGFNCLD
jgi:hypothetical protein